MHNRVRLITAVAAVAAIVLSTLAIVGGTIAPANAAALVGYDDCEALVADLRREVAQSLEMGATFGRDLTLAMPDAVGDVASLQFVEGSAPVAAGDSGAEYDAVGQGLTGTNLQEAAVDEPDTAKLADGRMVVLTNGRLFVMSSGPAPRLIGSVAIPASDISPVNTYSFMLFGNRAVVVVGGSRALAPVAPTPNPTPTATSTPTPPASPAPTEAPRPTEAPAAPTTAPPTTPGVTAPSDPAPSAPLPAAPQSSGSEPQPASDAVAESVPNPNVVGSDEPPMPGQEVERFVSTVRLILVDLSSTTPRILEEREQDGGFVDARVADGRLQLVTRSTPAESLPIPVDLYAGAAPEVAERRMRIAFDARPDDLLPFATRRNADGSTIDTGRAVSCSDVWRPTAGSGAGLVTLTTMTPSADLSALGTQSVMTTAETVYASSARLVVSTSAWNGPVAAEDLGATADQGGTTQLHTFDITGTAPRYVASGTVPGTLLNRWALSWHNGVLRAATTSEAALTNGGTEGPNQSRVVKLVEREGELVETGRVEGLGKTERITAVRYFGDVAVVITYRQTDPLYVVDLSGNPEVTGELKITGFSEYLHPIGDGKLLGIGVEATDEGVTLGRQVSVFDLSNPRTPTIVDRLSLGGINAEVPVGSDSRAFAYDPQNRTAYVPMSDRDANGSPDAGYYLGLVRSFTISGEGRLGLRPDIAVSEFDQAQRLLIDDEVVHAVAGPRIVTADRASAQQRGVLQLP